MTINVTRNGQSTSPIIWTKMTPWTKAAIMAHITIPGGDGIGVNIVKGRDNAVTTLNGRVPWTTEGQRQFENLAGSKLTIDNGIDERTGTAGTPQATESVAWIFFSITVTED